MVGNLKSKKRLLAIIPSFFGNAGNSVNENQLIASLSGHFNQIIVICMSRLGNIVPSRQNLSPNIKVILLPFIPFMGIIFQVLYSFFISILLCLVDKIFTINVIYVRGSPMAFGLMLCRSLSNKSIVKISAILEYEIKANKPSLYIRKFAHFLDRLVLSRANRVAVNSKSFYHQLITKRFYRSKNEPLIISAGINLSLIEKVKLQINKSISQDTIKIGFLGSLEWWQGVDIIVQTIAFLNNRFPNLRLIIIGDGKLRGLIDDLCRSLNISYEITGLLSHENALKRLGMLDLLVLPRKRTPTTESVIPIKVMEAWALGIPIIVTKHKVFLDEGLRDCEDLIYCEPNLDSVVNSVIIFLTQNAIKAKLKSNGPVIAKKFDYNAISKQLLKF